MSDFKIIEWLLSLKRENLDGTQFAATYSLCSCVVSNVMLHFVELFIQDNANNAKKKKAFFSKYSTKYWIKFVTQLVIH